MKIIGKFKPGGVKPLQMVSWQGMKMAALGQSWLVIVRMLSKPLEGRSLTIRFMATVSKGKAIQSVVMRK